MKRKFKINFLPFYFPPKHSLEFNLNFTKFETQQSIYLFLNYMKLGLLQSQGPQRACRKRQTRHPRRYWLRAPIGLAILGYVLLTSNGCTLLTEFAVRVHYPRRPWLRAPHRRQSQRPRRHWVLAPNAVPSLLTLVAGSSLPTGASSSWTLGVRSQSHDDSNQILGL